MKQKFFLLAIIIAITFTLSCNLGTKEEPGGGTASVSDVLKDLPEVNPTLPKSLRAPDAKSIRAVPRSIGDITELTSSNLNPVRSQAWIDLQNRDDIQLMLNRAIKFIGDYASNNEIAVDETFSAPIDATALSNIFKVPADEAAKISITNKCVIKGSDPKDITLYCRIHVTESLGTTKILAKVRIKTNEDDTKSLTINMNLGDDANAQKMYFEFDTATGDCTSVIALNDMNGNSDGAMIQRSIVGSGGEVTMINRLTSASLGAPFTHVAYGNDSHGGIASIFSFQNPMTGQDTDYCYQEYYNNEGHLIRRDYGSSTPLDMGSEVLGHQKNMKALDPSLTSPPSTIHLKEKPPAGPGDSSTYEYSTDGGTTYKALTGYGYTDANNYVYGFYYKTDSSLSTPMAVGDGIYSISSVDWDDLGGGFIGPIVYSLDYQVPATTAIFGKNFYIDYEYPLKNVLPVTSSDFVLIRKEAGSSPDPVEWEDWEGNMMTDTITYYDFYLNKNDTPKDALEVQKGDIDLRDKLMSYSVYYYSAVGLEQETGYFLKTTKSTVPGYFTTPDLSAVNAIKDGLVAATNNALTLSEANYSSDLITLASDSVIAGLTL